MPGFDSTGPRGAGPMTGGARGYCNPAGTQYAPRFGRGFGYGRGFGRASGPGFGRGYGRGFAWRATYPDWDRGNVPAYGTPYPEDASQEVNMLKTEADSMKRALDEIKRRIEELEKQPSQ